MAKRPPAPVRVLVLLAAIACLGLAMCARAERPPRTPASTRVSPPTIAPSASTTRTGEPAAPPDAAPPPPDYFPATKAAGAFYH